MHSMLVLAWLAVSGLGLAAPDGRERISTYSCPDSDVGSATAGGASPTPSGSSSYGDAGAAGYYNGASSAMGVVPTPGVSPYGEAEGLGDEDDVPGMDATDTSIPEASPDTMTGQSGSSDGSPAGPDDAVSMGSDDAVSTGLDGSANPDTGDAEGYGFAPGSTGGTTPTAPETTPEEESEGSQSPGDPSANTGDTATDGPQGSSYVTAQDMEQDPEDGGGTSDADITAAGSPEGTSDAAMAYSGVGDDYSGANDSTTSSPGGPAYAGTEGSGYDDVSGQTPGDSTMGMPEGSSDTEATFPGGSDTGMPEGSSDTEAAFPGGSDTGILEGSSDTEAAFPGGSDTGIPEGSSDTEVAFPGGSEDSYNANGSSTATAPEGLSDVDAEDAGASDDSMTGLDSTASTSPQGSSYGEPGYTEVDDGSPGATEPTDATPGINVGTSEDDGDGNYSSAATDIASPASEALPGTDEIGYKYGSSSRGGNSTGGGSGTTGPACEDPPTSFQLSDPPYENYFYSDCNTAAQVVVTSPRSEDNLTIIGPRLVVAWPAGNSGAVVFFAPQNGINGTLAIAVDNETSSDGALSPVYFPAPAGSEYPSVGVSGVVTLNDSAVLVLSILGSIRTIRDFTEGPSLLVPEIQNAIEFQQESDGGLTLSRLWLDNVTTTVFSFRPTANSANASGPIQIDNRTATFEAGSYEFSAHFNYPQLDQLSPTEVLKPSAQNLIQEQPDQAISLSFLSYSNKLLAGAWRFLTYFGRDSMISLLLLEPVLSEGEGGAMGAGIAAVLERLNQTDGNACHEETIGDYATFLNLRNNITSTAPQFDYKMIDTDYYLPVLLQQYFLRNPTGASRRDAFFSRKPTENPANAELTYAQLALRNAERIMTLAAPFAAEGNQTKENLIALKPGEIVGNWRDSTYGLGGGRIPYDVNTALVPAGLRAIAALSRGGFFPEYPTWAEEADRYAQVWEDETLQFFEVRIPAEEARTRVETYKQRSQFAGPSQAETIDGDVTFYAVALDGNNGLEQVEVMNSDDCFRHYFLNTTNQQQLTGYINQTANNIQRTFPAGLFTDVGVIVANPAYGSDPVYAQNFTNGAYHGMVVWSWNSLSMMARGLELQLDRCNGAEAPDFCRDASVSENARRAYNKLWDSIEANRNLLSSEVWSWLYRDNAFQVTPLGGLPPPPGIGGATGYISCFRGVKAGGICEGDEEWLANMCGCDPIKNRISDNCGP